MLITLLLSIDAILLFGLFLFYQSTIRSAFVQNVIIGILGFGFYSFWIPQIIRNVSRGCRKPLSPRYVIGISITRLTIPLCKLNPPSVVITGFWLDIFVLSLDFYAYPQNIIAQEPSFGVWVLVGYVVAQVGILFLQDTLGPRFFVPERVSVWYQSNNLAWLSPLISINLVPSSDVQLPSHLATGRWRNYSGRHWREQIYSTSRLCYLYVIRRYFKYCRYRSSCTGSNSVHDDTLSSLIPHWLLGKGKGRWEHRW